jgi:hypothetical protein
VGVASYFKIRKINRRTPDKTGLSAEEVKDSMHYEIRKIVCQVDYIREDYIGD